MGELHDEELQIVVFHLGGYIPPSYSKKDIESWEKAYSQLSQAYDGWEELRDQEGIDPAKLSELLSLLQRRRDNASRIVSRLQKNQWLTSQEKQFVESEQALQEQTEKIIGEIVKQ